MILPKYDNHKIELICSDDNYLISAIFLYFSKIMAIIRGRKNGFWNDEMILIVCLM